MKITYWTSFSKRKNSTKQPSSGTEIEVTLKQPTSIEAPEFTLTDANAADITYFKIDNHYYFVADTIRLTNDTVHVIGRQDVLATYKSAIGSTTAMIARSASQFNKYLRDDIVSVENRNVTTELPATNSMPFDDDGCFIISVCNDIASDTAYVANYILYPGLMSSLAEWLSGEGVYTAAGETWDNIMSFLILNFSDVFGCVRACKWIPVNYATATTKGSLENIHIGKYDTGIPAYRLTSNGILKDESATIDFSGTMFDDFRSAQPYSSVDVFLPFYGTVPIDPSQLFYGKLWFSWYVDLATGDCYVMGWNLYDKLLFSINYDIGVDTPIAQVGRTGIAVTQAASSAVGALASGNPLALAGASVGLISALASSGVTQKGSLSGRAMYAKNKITSYVTMMVTTPIDGHQAVMGRPLMEVKTISSLSGYVQCIDASVSINGRDADRDEINSYLNSGFFYE